MEHFFTQHGVNAEAEAHRARAEVSGPAKLLAAMGSSIDRLATHVSSQEQQDERKDWFVERYGLRYAGTHLIVDLWGGERLDDAAHMDRTLRRIVDASGATLLHIHLHVFEPNGGLSGVAVLAESHISVHSWPERGYAAFDVFMCGAARPHEALPILREAFGANVRLMVNEQMRGAV